MMRRARRGFRARATAPLAGAALGFGVPAFLDRSRP